MAETNYLSNLTVLTGILSDPLIAAFAAYRNERSAARKSAFLHELFARKAETNFSAYVAEAVIKDENAFSRACAAGDDISPYLKNAYIADLTEIGKALDFETEDFEMGKPPVTIKSWDDKAANLLYGFYQSSGYGKFINSYEFRYDRERGLVPVLPCAYSLADLKGYEREKAEIYDNLENFVKNLPCSHMLLYGESGTGRSSSVRAVANAFSSQKLRLVELAREDLRELPRLSDILSRLPLRFLVLVESLCAEDRLPTFGAENVLLAATSGTLLEGFGLTIPFRSVSREQFLAIVHDLAKDLKLKLPAEELNEFADRWSETHGFTPRSARLLTGHLFACKEKGKEYKI